MDLQPMPFDAESGQGTCHAIVRRNPDDVDEIEMVEAAWGSDPRFGAGRSFRFMRAGEQRFPTRRCLVPASEIHIRDGAKRYRAQLEGGNFFYLAAIWEPALGDWPLSYRVITIDANADIGRYQSRQAAIIHRRDAMAWLDHGIAEHEILRSPPARTFDVHEIKPVPDQSALAF